MSEASGVHWSKDYVEHLRAVHFALIGVCVSLIVLMLPAKDYDAKVALTQIEEIIRFEQEWSPQWAFENLELSPVPVTPCQYSLADEHAGVIDIDQTGAQSLTGSLQTIPAPERKPTTFRLVLPKPAWFQPGKYGAGKSGLMHRLDKIPSTKSGFQAWWDGLDTYRPTIYFPGQICPQSRVLVLGYAHPAKLYALVWDEAGRQPSEAAVTLEATVAIPGSKEPAFGYTMVLPDGDSAFFPFASIQELTLNKSEFTEHFRSWGAGPFKEAFYDLDQASKDIGYWELEDIKKRLAEDASKVDVLEVWGVKIPAGQLTLGGICLVLSIQFYLLIYLKALNGRLRRSDVGWDVPWIGMDTSRLARSALFLSLTILPFITICMVITHGIFNRPPHFSGQSYAGLPELTFRHFAQSACVFAAIVSLTFGIASWRFRPKSEKSAAEPSRP